MKYHFTTLLQNYLDVFLCISTCASVIQIPVSLISAVFQGALYRNNKFYVRLRLLIHSPHLNFSQFCVLYMDPAMEPKTMNYLTTELINFIKKNSSLEANTHYSSFMSGMESEGLILSLQQPRFESVICF